jgi:hypothetical protein
MDLGAPARDKAPGCRLEHTIRYRGRNQGPEQFSDRREWDDYLRPPVQRA